MTAPSNKKVFMAAYIGFYPGTKNCCSLARRIPTSDKCLSRQASYAGAARNGTLWGVGRKPWTDLVTCRTIVRIFFEQAISQTRGLWPNLPCCCIEIEPCLSLPGDMSASATDTRFVCETLALAGHDRVSCEALSTASTFSQSSPHQTSCISCKVSK